MQPAARQRGSDALASWVAVCLPIAVAAWRAAASPQWRADLASVRDLGLASVGIGGAVSTALGQALALLPLGTQSFRAALGAALAAGLAGFALFRIARRMLEATPIHPAVASLLAAVASLMATMSPGWQREATIGGGATVAAALLFLGIDRCFEQTAPHARQLTPEATRRWLVIAALVGLAAAESLPAGAMLLLTIGATCLAAGTRPPFRVWPAAGGLTLGILALGFAPNLLRPLAPRSAGDVGRALSSASLEALGLASSQEAALSAWVRDVGAIALLLAIAGLMIGVWRERRRAYATAIVLLVLVDLVYPAAGAELLSLHLGGIGALAIAASLGVAETVVFLRELRVPMAKTAAVIAVVFHVALVGLTSEEAAFAADRSDHFSAEEWTDAALEELPRDAAVFVHSPALAWRLWAAQTLAGMRPDVLVVPAPLLERGEVMRHLVPNEPAVSQLLQDVALQGVAGEYGLSTLADARPLRVELDRRWDARIVDHLRVNGPWLEFAPQRLGSADRKLARVHALDIEGRVARGAVDSRIPDRASAGVFARTLKEHVAALSLSGLRDDAGPLIDGVERLVPDDPFVVAARLRLDHAARRRDRRVELRDLLRFDRFDEPGGLVY
jgi:hypothetical protein